MLLEALIAILIFSIGILAVVGFRAVAVREITESKVRADASFLANQLIAEMWLNQTALESYRWAQGQNVPTPAAPWYGRVRQTLPGSNDAALAPLVDVTVPDRVVAITLRWKVGANSPGAFRVTTQLREP